MERRRLSNTLEKLRVAADEHCVKALIWLASSVVLVVMIIGVGLVAMFVFDATSLAGGVVGATLSVFGWHALRRLEPRSEVEGPPDDWPHAFLGVAYFVVLQLLVRWNPWLLVFGLLIFPIWVKLRRRS